MPRIVSLITALSLLLLPAGGVSGTIREGQTEGNILWGDLKIKANPPNLRIPLSFMVILYDASGSIVNRTTIPNNGRYRFGRVPNGEYEIAIEADSRELARVYILIQEVRFTDIRKDLQLEWRGAPGETASAPVLDRYPRSSDNGALMDKALAATAGKKYPEASALLKQIVQADPKDFEAWAELGTSLFMQGDRGEAEKAYKRALEQRAGYPVALLNLGKLQFAQKKYDECIQTLTQMISVNPDSAEAHRFLGESYLQIKKGSVAVKHLERAIQLDPNGQAEAHLRIAGLYNAAGYKNLAAAEYEKFLARKPDYPERQKLEKYIQENKKP